MNRRPVIDGAARRRQSGMSLIETMVGMTLGILVSLVITQVWGVFEHQKQRTVSNSSAQANGLLALTELEQDVRSAGAGLTDSAAFNCTTTYSYYEDGGTVYSPLPSYAGAMGLAPVQITDGGAAPDAIVVKRGADFLGAVPAVLTKTMPDHSGELEISTTSGFAAGDTILLVGAGGNCTVAAVTQVQAAASKLQHDSGGATTYNPPAAYGTANGWPAYAIGDKVFKVGAMIARTYTANASNQLTLVDATAPTAATTSVLAADIVMLKAQYGIAPVGSQNVSAWVSATAASGFNVLDSAKVRRIKAVRLAIVARSSKMEGANVTAPCTNLSGGVNNGPCAWPDTAADPAPLIDLSANPNWRRYRYRVYQTVMPIRNVIWAGV